MGRVSITLPDNTQITLETEETELLQQVVGMALRDLPRGSTPPGQDAPALTSNGTAEKSTGVVPEPDQPRAAAANGTVRSAVEAKPVRAATELLSLATPEPGTRRATSGRRSDPAPDRSASLRLDEQSPQSRDDFVSFCQILNPVGDMRRVVVAAEGAGRFLDSDGIDAEDLDSLFDLAGWRRPGNFTQTLRNAARAKFGWLERIPGRSGRYAVTALGRTVAVDDS